MSLIKFGTDGWRAVIAENFTFANVACVAQATADYWQSEIKNPASVIHGREPRVVIGYDRRFLSDRFYAEAKSDAGVRQLLKLGQSLLQDQEDAVGRFVALSDEQESKTN